MFFFFTRDVELLFFCQIYFCHSEEKLDPLISEEGAYMALLIIASYGKVVRQYVGSCVWYMFDGIYIRVPYMFDGI